MFQRFRGFFTNRQYREPSKSLHFIKYFCEILPITLRKRLFKIYLKTSKLRLFFVLCLHFLLLVRCELLRLRLGGQSLSQRILSVYDEIFFILVLLEKLDYKHFTLKHWIRMRHKQVFFMKFLDLSAFHQADIARTREIVLIVIFRDYGVLALV